MFTILKSLSAFTLVTGILAMNTAVAADTSIPFVDHGSIRDWHADSAEVLYVQDQSDDWYRITFWAPCQELPFATGISFVTDTIGALDKFSSIEVNGEVCRFRTFEPSEGPEGLEEVGGD